MVHPILDRLAVLIVSGAQADPLYRQFAKEKFTYTVINSAGGILQEPEICLLVGFQSERLSLLLEVIRKNCKPYRQYVPTRGFLKDEMADSQMVEVEVGGARFYLMNVERYEQI
jgi:uncharacterized protein YaaQ